MTLNHKLCFEGDSKLRTINIAFDKDRLIEKIFGKEKEVEDGTDIFIQQDITSSTQKD